MLDPVAIKFFAIFDIENFGADLLFTNKVLFSLNSFIYIVHWLLECEQSEGQRLSSGFIDLVLSRLFF